MTMIRFFVPERPFVKKRPRFGRGRAYTAPETVAAEQAVREYARRALPAGFQPFEGPVRLTVEFRFARAARQPVATRASPWHAHANDVDNLGKLILDALNPSPTRAAGLKPRGADWAGLWRDDGQVASVCMDKLWADDEHPEGTSVVVEVL